MSNKHETSGEQLCGWLKSFADTFAKNNNIAPTFIEQPKQSSYQSNILDIMNRNKKSAIETRIDELRQRAGLDLLDNIEKAGENDIENKEAMAKRPIEVGQMWAGPNGDSGEQFAIVTGYYPDQQNKDVAYRWFFEEVNGEPMLSSEKSFYKEHPWYKGIARDPKTSTPDEFFTNKKASFGPLSIRHKVAQSVNPMTDIKQFVSQVIQNRNGSVATPAIFEQMEKYLKLDKEWLRQNYEEIKKIIDKAHQDFTPQIYNNTNIDELARTDDPDKGKAEPTPFQPPATST